MVRVAGPINKHLSESQWKYFPIVLSVAFASFMARCNNYIVNISLPSISQYFHLGTGEVSRIVVSYLLVITCTLLLFGKLGDRFGLKRIFTWGYFAFVGGSLLCGVAWSIFALIFFRCLQGLGAAMLLATSFAIISKFLPKDRLGWAFGITSTSSALGVATGAPLGGIITGYLSWHWIFLLNVPFGIAAIYVAGRSIPSEAALSETPSSERERFDLLGVLVSFACLSSLLGALNNGRQMGWGSFPILSLFLLSAALLGLFIIRERRCKNPLLDLHLFLNLKFTFALLATFMAYLLISGNAFLLPFYLELVKGLNTQQSGMVLLVYSLIYVFLSSSAGRLSDRVIPAVLCIVAMISATLCSLTFSFTLQMQGLWPVLVFLVWLGLSLVLFFSPNNNQVMNQAPEGKQGTVSGIFNTTTNLSMAMGVALFEAVFSGVLPEGAMRSLRLGEISSHEVITGFSHAYMLGGLVCFCALMFSFLTRRKG